MKKLLSLSLLVALLCACNSSSTRCLVVDLSNYAELEDNAHFMMLFSNPLDSTEQVTIYWTGDKRYRYEIESSEDFLAFVDVYAIPENEDELNKLLFRTVVAIDGPEAIVSAENRYTVSLAGTPSNIQINALRTEQYTGEIPQEVDTMAFIKNYMQEEMSTHQNDLYGAYIYSYLSIMRLAEVEESDDMSDYMRLQQLIEEEKQVDTYLSKHNIALPYFERMMTVGDISSTLVMDLVRYMYPTFDYCFVAPTTHEYSQKLLNSLRGEPRQRMSYDQNPSCTGIIYIYVDSLNQVAMGMNLNELQLVTIDDIDKYFAQDIDPRMVVSIQACKDVKMGVITEIKQTIRKYNARKISYATIKEE